MEELTLRQILARTENLELTKEYHYNEQERIYGKPSIVSGGENLKRFSLTVKLHNSFCNPKTIIDDIEKKAENREIINYFLLEEYIGDFVIEKFNKNIVQTYKDIIIYAEINIDLLENPDSITEFEEQTKLNPIIENITDDNIQNIDNGKTQTVAERLKEGSKKLKSFAKNQSETIKDNVFSNVITAFQTGDISGLSNLGTQTLNTLQSSVYNDIKNAGITKALPIVKEYTNNMGNILNENQRNIIQTELFKIPDRIIKNALRG